MQVLSMVLSDMRAMRKINVRRATDIFLSTYDTHVEHAWRKTKKFIAFALIYM